MTIKTFKHKGLEDFFYTGSTKGIQAIHEEKLNKMLGILNVMESTKDIPPIYKPHPLKGTQKGKTSFTVQANWRLTFKFKDGNVYILNYEDYH